MVSLSPRFLFLAALCAAAAMPSLVLVTDARAVGVSPRHPNLSPVSHTISPPVTKEKGKGRVEDKDKDRGRGEDKGKGKDEGASGGVNLLSPLSLILPDILFGDGEDIRAQKNNESKDVEAKHTRALLASGSEPVDSPDQLVDIHIGLKEDMPYLGAHRTDSTRGPDHRRERGVQAAFNLEKRYDHWDHHHQDGLDLKTRAVSRIYGKQSLRGFDQTARSSADVWDPLDPFFQIGDIPIGDKHAPHYYHHYDHDKVFVAGDNDDVHIHEHHRAGEGNMDVIGSNEDVHIHGRHIGPATGNSEGGLYQKRSNSVDDTSASGVPGTVDIMVSGTGTERLASLVLSSVPDNSTANSTSSTNTTQAASPFILDASNTTQTQFYLVALPSESPSSALEATSSSNGEPSSSDVRVTLQVPVFVPLEAAMRPYCATFDPSPPAPAPLAMQRCFSDMESLAGNSSDPSMHKSQIFVYDSASGSIRPEWFGTSNSTGTDSPDPSTNSTSGPTGSQLDFRIPENSIKDVTSANNTAPSAPVSGGASSPRNVTLVFTPATLAVEDNPEMATFGPTDSGDNSADPASPSLESSDTTDSSDAAADDSPGTVAGPGDDADADNADTSATSDADTGSATSTDSSLAAPTGNISDESTESNDSEQAAAEPTTSSVSATSSATDVMESSATASTDPEATSSSTSSNDSIAAAPTPPPSPESDAIEMFEQDESNTLC